MCYKCQLCGEEFSDRKRKYCSKQCRERSRAKGPRTLTCCTCGKNFTSLQPHAKYCSTRCACRKRREACRIRNTHTCQHCGKLFGTTETRPNKGFYCSQQCSAHAKAKEKMCRTCGLAYFGKGLYCSNECREQYQLPSKQCVTCGITFAPSSPCSKYCSEKCSASYSKHCQHCGTLYTGCYKQMFCSPECGRTARRTCSLVCVECNIPFLGMPRQSFCSSKCRDRAGRLRRDALKRGAYVEPVGLGFLLERDKGICQICNRPVEVSKKAPHALSPSVDHIIPLSKGGEHSKANTQLAHFLCNSIKGARMVTD